MIGRGGGGGMEDIEQGTCYMEILKATATSLSKEHVGIKYNSMHYYNVIMKRFYT